MDDAPLPWKLRRDLEIQPSDFGVRQGWTIKDPLKLSYFHAAAEEMEFLRLLDGRKSLAGVAEAMRRSFPAAEFSLQNLKLFLMSAINGGLLIASQPGYGNRLAQLLKHRQATLVHRKLLSLLTWRLRGIDPTWILDRMDRVFGWVFQPRMLWAIAVFVMTSAMMVFLRWDQLRRELPDIARLASIDNLAGLAIAIGLIKILHELGHGLTCRHFGGECHELGLLIIGFFPLFYCDVSDSWLYTDRRKRVLVAFAGIGVELILAAGCAWLWMFSNPGVLHTFFYNVMLVCSLNTIMINGNPLLRYDGYYIVSDLLAIPNLASEARLAARTQFDRFVLGIAPPPGPVRSWSAEAGMILFGVASFLYRFIVLGSILWVIYHTLKPWRLEVLTLFLAASTVAGLLFSAGYGLKRRFREVAESGGGTFRAVLGLTGLGMAGTLILLTPWTYHLSVPFTLTSGASVPVFAAVAGTIEANVSGGNSVKTGEIIATLTNPDLDLAVARAVADLKLAETRVSVLTSQRSQISASSNALPAAVEDVSAAIRRLESLHRQRDHLVIRSPADGTILPPRNIPELPAVARSQGKWFGTPLDLRNRSAWIEPQTLVCSVGQPDDLRAICLVAQQYIELIRPGAHVTLQCWSDPSHKITGHVVRMSETPEKSVDRELLRNRMIAVSDADASSPTDTLFAIEVQIDDVESAVLPPLYSTGFAELECPPASLVQRLWRILCHTFSFRL